MSKTHRPASEWLTQLQRTKVYLVPVVFMMHWCGGSALALSWLTLPACLLCTCAPHASRCSKRMHTAASPRPLYRMSWNGPMVRNACSNLSRHYSQQQRHCAAAACSRRHFHDHRPTPPNCHRPTIQPAADPHATEAALVPTSPRSIEACFRLGLDPLELGYAPPAAFKRAGEAPELAEIRFANHERLRQVGLVHPALGTQQGWCSADTVVAGEGRE